ncbi:MAG: YIP1 family protein [Oscillospiraceae bacterium]|nr:YIP1 family protein [Oscillospiraceae bacterium]
MTKYFTRDNLYYFRRTLTNPVDSFYEIRHREQGSVPLALVTVFAFSLCFTLDKIFAGFIVNTVDPRSVNGLTDLVSVFLLFGLFSVGNWSVTCLMNGEGRLKDILVVTGYSLMPLILTYIPAILISNVLAANEEVFYTVILGFGVAWTAILILMGIMTVHNYTLLKTLITLVITLVAMFLIIFLALLLFDLLNQVYGFFFSVYTEFSLRG